MVAAVTVRQRITGGEGDARIKARIDRAARAQGQGVEGLAAVFDSGESAEERFQRGSGVLGLQHGVFVAVGVREPVGRVGQGDAENEPEGSGANGNLDLGEVPIAVGQPDAGPAAVLRHRVRRRLSCSAPCCGPSRTCTMTGQYSHLIGNIDYFPTLLEAAGAADRIPADVNGRSFRP